MHTLHFVREREGGKAVQKSKRAPPQSVAAQGSRAPKPGFLQKRRRQSQGWSNDMEGQRRPGGTVAAARWLRAVSGRWPGREQEADHAGDGRAGPWKARAGVASPVYKPPSIDSSAILALKNHRTGSRFRWQAKKHERWRGGERRGTGRRCERRKGRRITSTWT
jgi:hypothetical protein